ncbi:hypothetical protein ACFQ2B_33090 [Streptomyces stramineus]
MFHRRAGGLRQPPPPDGTGRGGRRPGHGRVALLGGPRADLGLSAGSLLVLGGSLAAAIATIIAAGWCSTWSPWW